mmetsp:Transcript_6239/g.14713  ORF Transcript_6239/g.14713 Transcript_6239/m.14713 type:complete len:304 (+) Transcript_6239:249-1160(+)
MPETIFLATPTAPAERAPAPLTAKLSSFFWKPIHLCFGCVLFFVSIYSTLVVVAEWTFWVLVKKIFGIGLSHAERDEQNQLAYVNKCIEGSLRSRDYESVCKSVCRKKNDDDDGGGGGNAAKIPTLRFDELLDVLVRLVPRFRFQLPPYFLNNARALATLEGMAREVDPSFNILRNLYPYAIRRVFSNPTGSPVVEKTLRSLVETPATGRLDPGKIRTLVKDASRYSGYSRRRVVSDVAGSESGPGLVARLVREQAASRLRRVAGRETTRKTKRKNGDGGPGGTKRPRAGRRVLDRLGDCLRL